MILFDFFDAEPNPRKNDLPCTTVNMLRAQWVLSQNQDFDVGYDHWFKRSYFDSPALIAQMPAGGNKDTDYFYLQVRVRL